MFKGFSEDGSRRQSLAFKGLSLISLVLHNVEYQLIFQKGVTEFPCHTLDLSHFLVTLYCLPLMFKEFSVAYSKSFVAFQMLFNELQMIFSVILGSAGSLGRVKHAHSA